MNEQLQQRMQRFFNNPTDENMKALDDFLIEVSKQSTSEIDRLKRNNYFGDKPDQDDYLNRIESSILMEIDLCSLTFSEPLERYTQLLDKAIYENIDLLNENILAISGIAILLAPGVFGSALKLAFSGLFGALKLLPSMATKMLGVTAVAGGIFNLGKDFQKEFNKTGSVSKSFAAALASEGEGGVAQALGNLGKFGLLGFVLVRFGLL